jgi:hypothetical protein
LQLAGFFFGVLPEEHPLHPAVNNDMYGFHWRIQMAEGRGLRAERLLVQ